MRAPERRRGPGNGAPLVQIDNFHNNTGNPADGQAAGRDIGRAKGQPK
jgi:hypothetical protein